MDVLTIKTDGKKIQLLEPVTALKTISISHIPGFPLHIEKGLAKPVCEWLYDLTQKATENIVYNGTVMSKEDIKGPEEIFKGK